MFSIIESGSALDVIDKFARSADMRRGATHAVANTSFNVQSGDQ
jgi:hypothetical protein